MGRALLGRALLCGGWWLVLAARFALAQPPDPESNGIVVLKGMARTEQSVPDAARFGSAASIAILRGAHPIEYVTPRLADHSGDSVNTWTVTPRPAVSSIPRAKFLDSSPDFGGTSRMSLGIQSEQTAQPPAVPKPVAAPARPVPPAVAKSMQPPAPATEHASVRSDRIHSVKPSADHADGVKPCAGGMSPVKMPADRMNVVTTGVAAETKQSTDVQPPPVVEGHADSWLKVALAQFVGNLAAILVGLTLFLFALGLMLRRYGLVLSSGASVSPLEPASSRELPELGSVLNLPQPSQFELGPSYAEEMRLKQEAVLEQEQAMLRQLVEQNVSLQEQIGKLQVVPSEPEEENGHGE
jgi:hypothetical protein